MSAITVPGFLLRQILDPSTIAMFYFLGVVGVAFWWGRGPALTASFLGVLLLDYFINPPYFSFVIDDPKAWLTLFVMLVESLVISTLAARSRQSEMHRIEAETEKNRNALLSAVSHDLRTPLTAISGAASGLLEENGFLDPESRRLLLRSIYDQSERMNRLVQNLLDMTRLESGAFKVRKEWHSVQEVVGSALERVEKQMDGRVVLLHLPHDLPLVSMDALLIEQLLLNLLENAVNHTPPGTSIELTATFSRTSLELAVSDHGPGLLPGEERTIFEKFTRGQKSGPRGVGLGLSICRGIARAHGGDIHASQRPGGGASFIFSIPLGDNPPTLWEE